MKYFGQYKPRYRIETGKIQVSMITSIKLCLHDEVGSHANQVEPKLGIEKYFFETPGRTYPSWCLDIKWSMPPWETAFQFARIHALWK